MAWHKYFVVGLVASTAVAACSTTASVGTGGDAASGGAATSTGGAATTGGAGGTVGISTGGTAGTSTGGTAGAGAGGKDAGPVCATDDSAPGACTSCVTTECAAEWKACLCDPACGAGGEYACIQKCLIGQVSDGGVTPDTGTCAAQCAVSDGGGVIASATNDMLACVLGRVPDAGNKNCQVACYGGPVPN